MPRYRYYYTAPGLPERVPSAETYAETELAEALRYAITSLGVVIVGLEKEEE